MIKELLLRSVMGVRRFIKKNFDSRNEDLPYYLTILISGLLFVVALNAFVELTDELAENELGAFDSWLATIILSYRTSWLTHYFIFITQLGDRNSYIFFTLLLAIFFLIIRKHSWKFIAQTTLVLILASLSNIALKRIIDRERPSMEQLVDVNSLSYPSGHAMSAMAFYGFLIFLCLRYKMRHWIRRIIVSLLVIVILSIGISRIYLGVHYPSDVAAGFTGGLIWVAFCAVIFSLIDLLRKRRKS
jgi:membrane-associated phospholipid phosphatase